MHLRNDYRLHNSPVHGVA